MYQEKEQNVVVKSSGLSLTAMGFITFIVFLILKVTGAWPEITWFWVWFPLWFPFAVGGAVLILALLGVLMASVIDK